MDGQQTARGYDSLAAPSGRALTPIIVDGRATAWRAAIIALAFGLGVLMVLCREPVVGAVRVWIDSATFNHCFLIIPISLYAIWDRRERWRHLAPRPSWPALALLPPIGLAYLAGSVANVLELQEFATVAFLQVMVLCVFGWRLTWALLFPLLYLFFLVPSGEWLVPSLQDFTANFVVKGLQLAGVPVYSDGVLISIPEADFRVAEACAGIRFLIASLAFGFLFADLVYTSLWRKLVFIALSLVIPVFANGLRAFGIVMIAHWTNARYAVGVDHIVYGWLFFSLVTILLMMVGWSFRDSPGMPSHRIVKPLPASSVATIVAVGLAATLLMAAAPGYAGYLDAVSPTVALDRLHAPTVSGGWTLVRPAEAAADGWHPVFVGPDREIDAVYRAGARSVRLVVAFYSHERQGAKAVSSVNRIADDELWQRLTTAPMTVGLEGGSLTVPASRLASGMAHRVAVQWYWVGGEFTASPVRAKLIELKVALLGGRRSAAAIALSAPYGDSPAEAAASIADFLAAKPEIAGMLDQATAGQGN